MAATDAGLIKLGVYGAAIVIGILVAIFRSVQAHGRKLEPSAFTPTVGPIERTYLGSVTNGAELIARAALQVPGASVVSVEGTAVFVNVRPNVGRLDDGMGLFVRAISRHDATGWHLRLEGQPKAAISDLRSAERALAGVERQLRAALATLGVRADDGLSPTPTPTPAPTPARSSLVPPPHVPPIMLPIPVGSTMAMGAVPRTGIVRLALVAPDGTRHVIRSTAALGRNPDPTPDPDSTAIAVGDPMASKTHAIIGCGDGTPWVEDRRSTNGTFVEHGGRRTEVPRGGREPLVQGDVVMIGDQRFTVLVEAT